MSRLSEIKASIGHRRGWLVDLDRTANVPNDGWPDSSTKARLPEFRHICGQTDISPLADAPSNIHEFDLYRLLLGNYSPAADARKTAITVRRELSAMEAALAMMERNETRR